MSMTEEFQKRQAEKPDTWTLSWWRSEFQELLKAYKGATHALNLVAAVNEDLGKANKELRERIQTLESDRAKIGEVLGIVAGFNEEFQKLKVRVDKMAEFLNQLKKAKP